MARKEGAKAVNIVFRIAALVLSVAATVVMGTASQLVVLDDVGRRWSSYAVSYSHYNVLVYFVGAGVIAAVCSAAGLYLTAVNANLAGAGNASPGTWAGSGGGNEACATPPARSAAG